MKLCLVTFLGVWACVSVVVAQNNTPPDIEGRFGLSDFFRGNEDDGDYDNTTDFDKEKDKILNACKNIVLPHLFRDAASATKNLIGSVTVCSLCVAIGKSFLIQRRLGATRQQLFDEFVSICTQLKIENERVCRGVIDLNLDSILYVVDNRRDLTAVRLCGIIFQNFNCPLGVLYKDWTVDVPEGRTIQESPVNKQGSSFNVLHITDIHYDSRYTPGANAVCGEPMCCQDDQPAGENADEKCGYWIDYRDADTPWHLVMEVMRQVNTHRFRYVYYTGDIMSHRVWETSIEKNTEDITRLFKQFQESFDVPVYPCLGNHEPSPLNVFSLENITEENLSTKWLYNLVADLWSPWLPPEALQTIRKGGYYTVSPEKGFRIISLNSNVCYSYNWWLILNDKDQYQQLQWMSEVLTEAERNGERVHILSHVPSGDATCLKTWSRAYVKIIQRFANTIVGQFVGHTHLDEFQVYYDDALVKPKAIGVAFNGASITTFTNTNPSYKIFEVEEGNYGLKDYEEWIFNVTEANLRPDEPINWYPLYKFTEAYGVESLAPSEIGDLVERMKSDRELTKKYFKYKSRNADPSIAKGCDDQCDKQNLCSIVTSVFGENSRCREAKAQYNIAQVPVLNKLIG